jgi:hypothetical protein
MAINPLKHPVYDLLPLRTQIKLLSPVSEDKLTWDCFFGLLSADKLGTVLASLLKIPVESLEDARLVLWGFEIRKNGAEVWEPLREVLSAVENYRDGKPEGQKTEPDVIVISGKSLVVAECKRRSVWDDAAGSRTSVVPKSIWTGASVHTASIGLADCRTSSLSRSPCPRLQSPTAVSIINFYGII